MNVGAPEVGMLDDMPNPLWVMFSPVDGDAQHMLRNALPDFLASYQMRPFHTTPMDFDGCLDGEGRLADDVAEMLAAERRGPSGIQLDFFVPEIRRYLGFVMLDQKSPSTLCLEVPRETLGADHPRFGKSGWLVGYLADLAHALHVGCCRLDRRFITEAYESLEPRDTVVQMRSGQLVGGFQLHTPLILIVRDDLVSTAELAAIVAAHPDLNFRLEHDRAHHVLWSMQPC